ncbi:aminotransferase class I/II-fold pyridoxal phosphate-dependent enzyme [Acinetobacter sp. YH12049]|uniref:aminotransferase class I/II-fold pyridoxal phosphate-dependent enzyme n=1 Tax=Acinetobacter sp. YH12049 TaxID=2601054 RepID=UPI0015D3D552|nr:aminotransferase class I/II-fold pyridoxal phosphate-dependent enzyme [Acinetobacter sp. YH12049]
MQAIILAAGKGSRLGNYTKENTKCMLEVNGEKLIDLSLKNLAAIGITKVVLVVGYQKDNLIAYLGNKKFGISITYIDNPIYETTNNIYSLYLAREYLKADDTLLLESDLIYDVAILEGLTADKRPSLAVVDKYQAWMDGTVVKLDKNCKITSFVPKAFFDFSEVNRYYKTVNIYKFSKEFSEHTYVPFLEAYSTALGNNEYYEQVLRVVLELENQELEAYPLSTERWYEIDDVQDKDNAEVVFAKTPELKLDLVQRRYGGYWRYPQLVDFCYLVNPYFPDEVFINECKAYFQPLISQYPSGSAVQSLLASKLFNIEPSQIVVTNGAAETIKVLSTVFKGKFGILEPTFYEYIDAIGHDRVIRKLVNSTDFSYGIDPLFELAKEVENIILINPDNPSGNFIAKADVISLLDYLKEEGKNLILDESFIDFAEDGFKESLFTPDLINNYNNLFLIKSISKSYGVPGARLGVTASSNTEVIRKIDRETSIWNINSFGEFFLQIIGKYISKYKKSCQRIVVERSRFMSEIKNISFLKVYPSQANYFLCEVVDKYTATELAQKLLFENELFVKDLTGKKGFEDRQFLRIAVRDEIDNDKLLSALKVMQ